MVEKLWVIPETLPEDVKNKTSDIHPVVLQLLWNRGLRSIDEMERFLRPDYNRDVYHHSLFSNMPRAVERVFAALERGERVRVHGDYDADGICGAAVLFTTLRDVVRAWKGDGAPSEALLSVFLPDREKDGYGFAKHTVESFADDEVGLVITVDCGISNKETIERGRELGIDSIICDHHAIPGSLPNGAILIHPLVSGETYPNKHLSGTGVASKLCWAILDEARKRGMDFPDGYEKWLLDFVAIATVTDIVPLIGENRVLEKYGLTVLNKTRRPGLKKLISVSGIKSPSVDTWSIGFQLGPRINASGRIGHANDSLKLLIEEDEIAASMLAGNLDGQNRARQKASDALYKEAKGQVDVSRKLIVACGDGWHLGLVGLVAGKLLSDYGRPVFVVAKHGGMFTGSGRSIPGFDMTRALGIASNYFHKFGGHPQACGFTVVGDENFKKAMEAVGELAEKEITDEHLTPKLYADAEIKIDDIDFNLVEALGLLAPFGVGNPQPVFISRRVQIANMSACGKDGAHLKMRLCDKSGDKTQDAIGFGFGNFLDELAIGDIIDVAYELCFNEWNGNRSIQLKIVDIKK